MIKVVELNVPLQTAAAFEVAIASTMRDLREYDSLDQHHQDVSFLQIFESKNRQWFGVFCCEPLGSGEPLAAVQIRTPVVEKTVIEEDHF